MELPPELRAVVAEIVRKADTETMTLSSVRKDLEKAQGLEPGSGKRYKKALKRYVSSLLTEEGSADVEDARMISLKALGSALKFGPALYRGLKEMDVEARARRGVGA